MSDPTPEESGTEPQRSPLRGSFVAVLLMAAFFALTWVGMFVLVLERR